MKILLVSPLPPPAGGIATWTKLYINSKKVKDNSLIVVNTAVKGSRIDNFVKRSIKAEVRRTLDIYKKIKRYTGHDEFDVVHFNTSCSKLGMIRDYICAKEAKGKGGKLILQCHCDTSYMVQGRIAEYFFEKLCNISDRILCLNRSSRKHIKSVSGKDSVIIPNFIELKSLNIMPEKIISEVIKTIIYVGHITKSKGCSDIISVAKKLPTVTFKLIGYLSDEIKEIPISDNIEYLGEVSKDEVINQMLKADLLLFPSYSEGFPNVVLEAMACGLPIVATPVGAIPDMVKDSGGILVDVGDIEGMVQAIENLQDRQTRLKVSRCNKERVTKEYTVDTVINQIFIQYSQVLDIGRINFEN